MLTPSFNEIRSRFAAAARLAPARNPFRRSQVTLTSDQPENTYQPQDGAAPQPRAIEFKPRSRRSIGEPEDAGLTGGTRSLMRRLSGLNLGARRPTRPAPAAIRAA